MKCINNKKFIVLGLLWLILSVTAFAQGNNVGYDNIESGAKSTGNLIIVVAKTAAFVGGLIATIWGLWLFFKSEDRQEPGSKKKGIWLFVAGAIFASGAGMSLAGGVSKAFFNKENTAAKTQWEQDFGDTTTNGGG
ncbi:MAG: hypothetical protein QM504_03425 [Pseudomonadota bacterium]